MKPFRHLWQYLAEFFLEWEMFQIKVVEKINIHVLCSISFFFRKSCLYEIMSKNPAKPERPQMTVWRRVTCWINTRAQAHASARAPSPTRTQRKICNTHYFSTATMVSWTRRMLRCTYVSCLRLSFGIKNRMLWKCVLCLYSLQKFARLPEVLQFVAGLCGGGCNKWPSRIGGCSSFNRAQTNDP
jgi:hypothetical protein